MDTERIRTQVSPTEPWPHPVLGLRSSRPMGDPSQTVNQGNPTFTSELRCPYPDPGLRYSWPNLGPRCPHKNPGLTGVTGIPHGTVTSYDTTRNRNPGGLRSRTPERTLEIDDYDRISDLHIHDRISEPDTLDLTQDPGVSYRTLDQFVFFRTPDTGTNGQTTNSGLHGWTVIPSELQILVFLTESSLTWI